MDPSVYKKIGLASLIMMASVFLSRLFGFIRLMVIAYVGGRSAEVDAYQIAFVIPEILNHVIASGFRLPLSRFFPAMLQLIEKHRAGKFFQ
jgi:putative peptidoglycan lipid II flippase